MNKVIFVAILVSLFILASLVSAQDKPFKVTLDQNEKIVGGFIDDGKAKPTNNNSASSSSNNNQQTASSSAAAPSAEIKKEEVKQEDAAPAPAAETEQPKPVAQEKKQDEAPAAAPAAEQPKQAAPAAAPAPASTDKKQKKQKKQRKGLKVNAKKVVAAVASATKKVVDAATGAVKTILKTDVVGTLPTVDKAVAQPKCANTGMYGPSNINGEKATAYKEQMEKKGCRLCTVDCAAIWAFAEAYEGKWFDDFAKDPKKRPDLYVVEDSNCKCRYYNYGCQLNTHCASYDSFDEMLTAISFCMIHNGCKFNSKIKNDQTMREFVSKFSQVGDIIMKPNTVLMTHESKILRDLGVRAGIIYHYKRVQDVRDAVMLGKSFEEYSQSSLNWDLSSLPSYLSKAIDAHPITKKLYDRIAYKINVLKFLPEDESLKQVREKAKLQVEWENRVSELYTRLNAFSLNVFEKLELSFDLGNAYYELLMNEIESLRIGTYLTFETEEEERANKIRIDKECEARAAAAGERAELALLQLFLSSNFGVKLEALKKLFTMLGKVLQAKVLVHLNKIAGKVSDAAMVAIATMTDGAAHAAREITGVSSTAAYAIKYGVDAGAKAFAKFSKAQINQLKNIAEDSVNKVGNFGKSAVSSVSNAGKTAMRRISRGFNSAASKISGGFRSAASKVSGGFRSAARKISGGFRKLGGGFRKIGGGFRKIGGGFRSAARKISGGFRKLGGGFRKIGGGFRSAARKVSGGFRKIGGGFRSAARKISGGFRKIGGGFRSAGRKIGRFFRRW